MGKRRTAGGDATGHAQRVPLAKMVRYYRTHLANGIRLKLKLESMIHAVRAASNCRCTSHELTR